MPRRLRLFSPAVFEPDVSKSARKAQGIYYTPPEIVRRIVDLTLGPLLRQERHSSRAARTLDPSCGAGEFLVAAFELLNNSRGIAAARQSIWGVDVDPAAVQVAQSRLLKLDPQFPTEQIVAGDTLAASRLIAGSFDAIIGNPPYVNIRQLAKTLSGKAIEGLRQSYSTARGNFDLYVLFIERAMELLHPGGRCGFIVPSKWATLDYACECRKLLLSQTTIEHVIDFSAAKVFRAANVYPHVLVFRKAIAKSSHEIEVSSASDQKPIAIPQATLSDQAIQLSAPLDIESRILTAPLSSLGTITCGTAGYAAAKIARRIFDGSEFKRAPNCDAADFITSGNIDRYQIQLGNVRYLNHRYVRPKLPLAAPELTPVKQRLFKAPKIVVAGLSRRLEAAWDSNGLALGVQVYAISGCQLDPFYLLGLLNSKLLSYLFATRFAAKRLGGGYLAINKGQLAQLPIGIFQFRNHAESQQVDRIARLAKDWLPSHESRIDQLVYELYRLSEAEIARIELHFAEPAARAA